MLTLTFQIVVKRSLNGVFFAFPFSFKLSHFCFSHIEFRQQSTKASLRPFKYVKFKVYGLNINAAIKDDLHTQCSNQPNKIA